MTPRGALTTPEETSMPTLLASLATALASTALVALLSPAAAQGYPERPITMIVPFAAGGPTDVVARIVSEHMSRTLGQQVVIENVTGAGGTTGITRGAEAEPDGYTIMMGHMGTHGAAPALYPDLRYDPATDFAPIGLAAGTPIVIVARNDLPADDLDGFIAYAKDNEAALNQAHAGVGSVSHSTGTLLNAQLGIEPVAIAYKGTGPALNDLMAGTVDYMADQIVNVAPQITAGTIKAYAIATPERSPALPDVPTTAEAGLPDYQVSAWNAVFAPKGVSEEIVLELSEALSAALDDPETRGKLEALGAVVPGPEERTPAALQALVEAEVARWTPVLEGAVD